jgi:hypothetical protein
MRLKLQKISLLLDVLAALLLTANIAAVQEDTTLKDTTPKKRLRSQAIVKGFIGGESHDSYVIRGSKGRTMIVQISWRRQGNNRAEFAICESHDFFDSEPVKFGKESDNSRRWTGKIPRTANYYIYVVGHPAAHYTLKVSVN